MQKTYYKGFSTRHWLESGNKSFNISNLNIVKQDLLNHIYTEKGERVMMPEFGTRIPTLVFEQNDPLTVEIVKTDLTEVFNYDPRVELLSLVVLPITDNNILAAIVEFRYIEFDVKDVIRIELPLK